jgi:Super-infection exclusion protein B
MIMESLLAWIKLPQKVSWPILFVCALVLWGPESFNQGLGLDLFIDKYRIWVGVCVLFFLATAFIPVIVWGNGKYTNYKERKYFKKRLAKLTQEEKGLFLEYLNNDTRSRDLNIQNGVVGGLIKCGFISLAFNCSYGGIKGSYTFPVNINEWVWDYLKENMHLLDGTEETSFTIHQGRRTH